MRTGLSRRRLLGTMMAGAATAVTSRPVPAQLRQAASGGRALQDRAQLAAQPPDPSAQWSLREEAGGGSWTWAVGDQSAAVRSDPLQGLIIPHARVAPTVGAWRREWDRVIGRPEWFGARADAPKIDCRPAIQAALDLCPTVQLGPGAYHIARGLKIERSGTRLLGSGITQTDQGANVKASQIVCASPTDTIVQIGSDSPRQPARLTETVQLADFTVRRLAAPFIPASGFGSAVGIAMRWCVNCHVERVFSIDSARGWHFFGTIENYVVRCAALRRSVGSNPANDHFIGFHLDYNAPLSANGGNASLYIDHCRAFGGFDGGTPPFVYSAGLRTDGGWVDLFIDGLETGAVRVGIDGRGDSTSAAGYRTENLSIANCVLDPGYDACIRLKSGNAASAVQITNNYCGVSGSGASIALSDLAGSVSLTGNQCIVSEVGGIGLSASNVNNLRSTNNIFTKHKQPIRLERVTNFALDDSIKSIDPGNSAAAITLVDCSRGKVSCSVSGTAGANSAGLELVGSGNSQVEVDGTLIQASTVSGRKLVTGGTAVRATGRFGNDCVATGVMG